MILKGIIPALLYVFFCVSTGYAIDLSGSTKYFNSAKKAAGSITNAARSISDEEEYYVGRAVAAKILGTYQLLENRELTRYVNLVGKTITLSSDKPFTYNGYHFGVLDTDEVNAFACPGGTILITKGMIKATRSEDELAAVLAHEVAHISNRDGIGAISSSRWTEALTIIGSEAAKTYGPSYVSKLVDIFEGSIDDIFKTLIVNGYGRSQELAADTSALQYLEKSGYNPAALNDFLGHLSEVGQATGGGMTKTHPGTSDRIKNISGKMPSVTIDPQAFQKRTVRFSTALNRPASVNPESRYNLPVRSTPSAVEGATSSGVIVAKDKEGKDLYRERIIKSGEAMGISNSPKQYRANTPGNIQYGHYEMSSHPQNLGALAFANYIRERSRGDITVEVFPWGQLGGERSMANQVRNGTLHVTAVTADVLGDFIPELNVLELPFIFPDRTAVHRVLDDKEVKERISEFCAAQGFTFIGYAEVEFRDITNSRRPIKTPDDLRGMKIRTIQAPIFIDTFKTLGANPAYLPSQEVYYALKQGTIDGQDNPLSAAVFMKFFEVNKYATLLNHILTVRLVVVNKKYWETLSPEQQKIFIEAADIQTKVNREESAKNMAEVFVKAKAQLVEITGLTGAERDVFKKAVKPLLDKYRGICGADWYDFFISRIDPLSGKK